MSRIERRGLAYYLDGIRIEDNDVFLIFDPKTRMAVSSVAVRLDAGQLRFFIRNLDGSARETQLDHDANVFAWPPSTQAEE
jgi:hypothetical protein